MNVTNRNQSLVKSEIRHYIIRLTIYLFYLSVYSFSTFFQEKVEGLMGTWDDNRNNDLTPQGGSPVDPKSSPEVIFNNFGQTCKYSLQLFKTIFIPRFT